MKKICFVSSGEGSRSIIAEKLLKNLLSQYKVKGIKVDSGCLNITKGDMTSKKTIFALKRLGINIRPREERQITLNELNEYDIVFTMTKQECNYLRILKNVQSLAEFTSSSDVESPKGKTQDEYNIVAEKLEWQIKILAQKICLIVKGD